MASHKDNQRPTTERRVFNLTNCEVRSTDDGGATVFSGYAAVFNELSVNLGGFRERIQPGCFRDAVDEGQDVRFLINHDANMVLGRTRSGTVTLTEDEVGLRVECELPNTTYAIDLAESMRRKDVDQMSFGFVTRADDWKEKDGESGLPIRELLRADLFDVSVVTYPAYPDTTAEVRTWIAEQNPELLERATRAAADLNAEPAAEADEVREEPAAAEEPAAEAAAEPAEERVGKTLSSKNTEALTAAAELLATVLATAAQEIEPAVVELNEAPAAEETAVESREDIARPDFKAFREWTEERGWGYDDDWSVWTLTQMIEAASCFLLYADDSNDEDAAADVALADGMKSIMAQLTALLNDVVAEGARAATDEVEEREEPTAENRDEETSRFDIERRRLALAEHELNLAL